MCDARDLTEQIIALVVRLLTVATVPGSWRTGNNLRGAGRADREAYVRQVREAMKVGGHVIVASFGPKGPHTCSGLDVVRYDAESLHGLRRDPGLAA